jgi:cytochrome c biogenesis protein CcmG/thiol:disulfide interchange protein DsbE
VRRWVPRRRTRLLAGVTAAVAVIVVLLVTGLGKGSSVTASPLVGRMAPNFTLPQLDGPPVTLSKLQGQVIVINFWASWCTECQAEQVALDQTWQQFQDSGVVMLGVNFEDSTSAARAYVSTHGVTYPVVEDSGSHAALAYGLRGVPETFVVNRSGRIVNHVIGPVTATVLASEINTMLASTK